MNQHTTHSTVPYNGYSEPVRFAEIWISGVKKSCRKTARRSVTATGLDDEQAILNLRVTLGNILPLYRQLTVPEQFTVSQARRDYFSINGKLESVTMRPVLPVENAKTYASSILYPLLTYTST